MCGRSACSLGPPAIRKTVESQLQKNVEKWTAEQDFSPNCNICPGNKSAVVMHVSGNEVSLATLKFGYDAGGHFMINKRSETITKKWAAAKRCAVIMEGYYEWKKDAKNGKEIKRPFFLFKKGGTELAFAAAVCNDTEDSYLILTQDAIPEFAHIHDRMPMILSTAQDVFDYVTGTHLLLSLVFSPLHFPFFKPLRSEAKLTFFFGVGGK
eukprot:ANDGO_00858.mRNA.2 Putative SOS response-associated peptidase YedK